MPRRWCLLQYRNIQILHFRRKRWCVVLGNHSTVYHVVWCIVPFRDCFEQHWDNLPAVKKMVKIRLSAK